MQKLHRHQEASDKLAKELDIVKLIYVQRIGQFLAKVMLKRHQRALVTSFKHYQLDDLVQSNQSDASERDENGVMSAQLLQTAVQADDTTEVFSKLIVDEKLSEDQVKLLTEIVQQFRSEDNDADLSILYEVTGFKADSNELNFWDNYQDFDDFANINLVRLDKNELVGDLGSRNLTV